MSRVSITVFVVVVVTLFLQVIARCVFPSSSSSSVCIILQYVLYTHNTSTTTFSSFYFCSIRSWFLSSLTFYTKSRNSRFLLCVSMLLPSRESELISVSARPLVSLWSFGGGGCVVCQELGRVEPSLNSRKVVAFASFFFLFSTRRITITLTTKGNSLCFAYIFESSLFVSLLFGVRCGDLFPAAGQSGVCVCVCCHLWAQSTLYPLSRSGITFSPPCSGRWFSA